MKRMLRRRRDTAEAMFHQAADADKVRDEEYYRGKVIAYEMALFWLTERFPDGE